MVPMCCDGVAGYGTHVLGLSIRNYCTDMHS